MIQRLASNYQRRIAFSLFLLFEFFFLATVSVKANAVNGDMHRYYIYHISGRYEKPLSSPVSQKPAKDKSLLKLQASGGTFSAIPLKQGAIGGPGQPEMASFKPVSANNMVNLFTGDFSYNIPLLDVGGYPVNIYYNGDISMESEASWVGLGWNINPGNVSRNMRGVPDDFDGTDVMVQSQNVKPNKTWGVSMGADLEICGIKSLPASVSAGINWGVSFNNYLGPSLDLAIKGGVGFKIAGKSGAEKSAAIPVMVKVGVGADINSRSGFTLSPNVSLTASSFVNDRTLSVGMGLSTSYNSRSGIKALQINEQVSYSKTTDKYTLSKDNCSFAYKQYSSSNAASLFSSSISFAKPSYIPSIRMPMTNEAYSGHFQVGGGIFGVYGSVEAEVYKQTSSISSSKVVQQKPLVGYLYYEKAMSNPNAVMDFTRVNDKEVTPNTTIISAPQYTYDVFTIQGEGTGGSIRAYRNDLGSVRDNTTGSQDKSTGIGGDIGIPGHYGANVNLVSTPSTISEWGSGNKIRMPLQFQGPGNGSWENVYFRNPGETSVLDNGQFDRIGGTDLVRFQLSGDPHTPAIEPTLDRFSKAGILTGTVNAATTPIPAARKKRTQVIDFLTASDATLTGLDKQLKSFDNQSILDNNNNLIYQSIPRYDNSGYRKDHHISQINVTESNGKRYVYGVPVYNTLQKDFTFTVGNSDLTSPATLEKISYTSGENDPINNPAIGSGAGGRDGYVQVTQMPAYAHSFLLSGLLSPDYVDVTGDGITEDDLGDAVKFNYTMIQSGGTPVLHRWRTPVDDHMANFNPGHRSEVRDDKGIVSYGERESWYMHSIESKTMIALFKLGNRADGQGVNGVDGQINSSENAEKCLTQIDLYSKADLKANGLAKAKPIKTVHFVYSYRLCQGTPDNPVGQVTPYDNLGKGKLTLESIYFTYNGQNRASKNQYVFSYLNTDGTGNPAYTFNATDRWGTYKPESMNPKMAGGANMKNNVFPYTPQDQQGQSVSPRSALDQNAGAWALKKVLLPSGGQIEVGYESDDYAYVQNRRATDMLTVAGFGNTPAAITNRLYDLSWQGPLENVYVFIAVPQPCTSATDVYQKYLQGMDQIAVKLAVNMPKGLEYLTSYGNIDSYGVFDATRIWIKLKTVNGLSPLSLTAVEFLREQLPGQAFPGYDVSESSGLQQVGEMLIGMMDALKNAFNDPVSTLRSAGKAQVVDISQSFVRLNDPDGFKNGGGSRVKSVILKDNWSAMTQQYTSYYGQTYDYTTTEVFNGTTRTISSGVASYEPSVGSDENPFQTIKQVADKLPLGPTSYGAIELPVLDGFFPSPSVGYSKVTAQSVSSVKPNAQQKSRSGIGKQVTEYYTSKDYPVFYSNTELDPSTDKQAHDAALGAFFYKYAFDSRALSQGFLVELNDMNGKMRSQSSYADNDPSLRVNYTENFYRNTGSSGLNEQFNFVSSAQGGIISPGNMGIDIELMTDTRQFTVKSNSTEIEGQVDLFPVILPIWLPFIWPVFTNSENTYRAVTTTKVINYHSVLDHVVAFDKGSQVSTQNLVYDAETGDVIVNRTYNEFDQPVYTTSYPAWWAYSGMGPAYKNTEGRFFNVNFSQGRITNQGFDQTIFESGDELYITSSSNPLSGCDNTYASTDQIIIWAMDTYRNSSSLTNPTPDYIFLDKDGNPFTKANVNFRIIRSGKRNMLDLKITGITSMGSPILTTGNTMQLSIGSNSQAISATAGEYREKWQQDPNCFGKFTTQFNAATCSYVEVPDCAGHWIKNINPYRYGLLGNFRLNRSWVFYGKRVNPNPATPTNLSQDGSLDGFSSYWIFNPNNNLVPQTGPTNWVWNNQQTKFNGKGMELETKNALGIFTSAQYGFNQTLPNTIVNNAASSEAGYDGFEDVLFQSSLNNVAASQCNLKYFDFSNIPGTTLINTDGANFNAHTGKYVLGINNNSTVYKNIPISTGPYNDYSFDYIQDITKSLYETGGTVTSASQYNYAGWGSDPVAYVSNYMTFPNGGCSFNLPLHSEDASYHSFNVTTSYYINVPQTGTYQWQVSGQANVHGGSDGVTNNLGIGASIYDLNNRSAGNIYASSPYTNQFVATASAAIFLCKGIYRVDVSGGNTNSNDPDNNFDVGNFTFSVSNNIGSLSYKSPGTMNGCTLFRPITAKDEMMNPAFTMPAGKKMVLSAWVREGLPVSSNGITNPGNGYVNNKIKINDGRTNTDALPTGPVIDGWQRYEAVFTPAASGTASITFVNSGNNMIYFDDIRIHPFNANMKSYIYDPISLRLVAELDANNYATFYEYDEEGTLIRTKAETVQGIKTIKETRSAKQKNITTIQ